MSHYPVLCLTNKHEYKYFHLNKSPIRYFFDNEIFLDPIKTCETRELSSRLDRDKQFTVFFLTVYVQQAPLLEACGHSTSSNIKMGEEIEYFSGTLHYTLMPQTDQSVHSSSACTEEGQ